ncbi:hypothetical protein [Candidatus Endomicrobiellum pyrsonymphae]
MKKIHYHKINSMPITKPKIILNKNKTSTLELKRELFSFFAKIQDSK